MSTAIVQLPPRDNTGASYRLYIDPLPTYWRLAQTLWRRHRERSAVSPGVRCERGKFMFLRQLIEHLF